MESLVLACRGEGLNSVDSLTPDCLGWAGLVYEHVRGVKRSIHLLKTLKTHVLALS